MSNGNRLSATAKKGFLRELRQNDMMNETFKRFMAEPHSASFHELIALIKKHAEIFLAPGKVILSINYSFTS